MNRFKVVDGVCLSSDPIDTSLIRPMQVFPTAFEQFYPYLRDLITGAIATGSLVIAWKGLQTWSRQLKGTHDYEAARQILGATLSLRDALQRSRIGHFGLFRVDPTTLDLNDPAGDRKQYEALVARYEEHYCAPVRAARLNLQAALFEAEVLVWDGSLQEVTARVEALFDEWNLDSSIYIALQEPGLTSDERDRISSWWDNHRRVVGLDWNARQEPDAYNVELVAATALVRTHLARHIKG